MNGGCFSPRFAVGVHRTELRTVQESAHNVSRAQERVDALPIPKQLKAGRTLGLGSGRNHNHLATRYMLTLNSNTACILHPIPKQIHRNTREKIIFLLGINADVGEGKESLIGVRGVAVILKNPGRGQPIAT